MKYQSDKVHDPVPRGKVFVAEVVVVRIHTQIITIQHGKCLIGDTDTLKKE